MYSATPHPKIGGPDFDKKTFSLAMDAVLVRYGSGAGEGGERRKHEAERKGLQTSQQAEKETQKKGLEALEQRRRVKLYVNSLCIPAVCVLVKYAIEVLFLKVTVF